MISECLVGFIWSYSLIEIPLVPIITKLHFFPGKFPRGFLIIICKINYPSRLKLLLHIEEIENNRFINTSSNLTATLNQTPCTKGCFHKSYINLNLSNVVYVINLLKLCV